MPNSNFDLSNLSTFIYRLHFCYRYRYILPNVGNNPKKVISSICTAALKLAESCDDSEAIKTDTFTFSILIN